ncbi:MAG: hypothetical protein RL413_1361, partial [Actinomycetota bacterium]
MTVAAMSLGVASPTLAAPGSCSLTSGAGGTYLVTSEADLLTLRTDTDCLDESIVQTNSFTISVGNRPWTPINNFVGTYNGQNKSIGGLELDGDSAGLFNVGNTGATFSNLTINLVASSAGTRVGALIGLSTGPVSISTVAVTGAITATGDYLGGVVGSAGGDVTISATSFTGSLVGDDQVGGIISNSSGTVVSLSDNTVTGNVVGVG